jgi:hypothetical protein
MAGRLIITTVGTSALEAPKLAKLQLAAYGGMRLPETRRKNVHASDWWMWLESPLPAHQTMFADYQAALNATLKGSHIADWRCLPRIQKVPVFSAELTSLHLLKPARDDRITLLSSDTAEGALCTVLCAHLLAHYYPEVEVTAEIVEDLTPDMFDAFFASGIGEFAERVRQLRLSSNALQPILNVTGGFKGLLPLATCVALKERISIVFSFEDTGRLVRINLPDAETLVARKEHDPDYLRKLLIRDDAAEPVA